MEIFPSLALKKYGSYRLADELQVGESQRFCSWIEEEYT